MHLLSDSHVNSYGRVLADLYARSTPHVKLGLANMRALLKALGEPQLGQRFVAVAGTNGKGSTSCLLAKTLQLNGLRVGLYTSPHLLRFAERIRINGIPLADLQIMAYYQRILKAEAAQGLRATFFECATAMALLAYREAQVDMAVLEVGLGGRLDATHVVEPELTVLTPIDYDHQAYLGNTLTLIAGEKADMIARFRPVVVAPQHPEAQAVIEHVAQARQAPITLVVPSAQAWVSKDYQPAYQNINIATAMTAAKLLGCKPVAMQAAVRSFAWPGRYQWLAKSPAWLLDGAHNPAGMRAFLAAVQDDPRCKNRPLVAVFGALAEKEAFDMLSLLAVQVAGCHLCPVASTRSLLVEELQDLSQASTFSSTMCVHADVAQALSAAAQQAGSTGVVLVTGSLFLVAEALSLGQNLPRDPPVDG